MSKSPKLKVRSLLHGLSQDETVTEDLEQVKAHFNETDTIIVVEGRIINSYDELARLIAQDQFQAKESLEVMLLPVMEGG